MRASDNPYPSILVNETTAPSAPAASKRRLYVDANHVLHWIDSGSVDSPMVAVNKWNATTAPAVTDDSGDGYAIGSRWIDTTNDKEYVCTDASVGAAVWKETTAAGGAAAVGSTELIYRYTVAGSDKASIDTTSDSPDAGSGDWTDGDLLEFWLFARTDEAGLVRSTINLTFNNDTSSIYDREYIDVSVSSVSGAGVQSAANWQFVVAGNAAGSGVCGAWHVTFPNYMGGTFNKNGTFSGGVADSTNSSQFDVQALNYRSATAVSRLKVIPNTGGVKFKIGTQLLVYKRTAS